MKSKNSLKGTVLDELAEARAGSATPEEAVAEGEQKGAGKITHMQIKTLDDGTYTLHSETDKGHHQITSHPNPSHLLTALHDNLTSPHLPKLGNGQRFSGLKDKLAQEPGVKNPAGLAAYIGRKKMGASKFDALSR